MNKWGKIIIGLGVAGSVVMAGVVAVPALDQDAVEECDQAEVSLDMKHENKKVGPFKYTVVSERLCMTPAVYSGLKGALLDDYNDRTSMVEYYEKDGFGHYQYDQNGDKIKKQKQKDYDFDVNNREILASVLSKEAKDQGKGSALLKSNQEKINLLK